jgi:coenzyme F420-0:L-glutamate ligase/coenzyme F420-1:gamma-L-glutamate ligase
MKDSRSSDAYHEFLRSRRSVRQFDQTPVPEEVIWRILETATWSPSAHHRQPWRFAILVSRDVRVRLVDAMNADFRRDMERDGVDPGEVERTIDRSRTRILEAPIAILVCQDNGLGDNYPDPERQRAEFLMGVQSVAMAGVECLLAAPRRIGESDVCTSFAQETTQALICQQLGTPGLILLGYPVQIQNPGRGSN